MSFGHTLRSLEFARVVKKTLFVSSLSYRSSFILGLFFIKFFDYIKESWSILVYKVLPLLPESSTINSKSLPLL